MEEESKGGSYKRMKGGRLGDGSKRHPLKIVEIGLQIDRARVNGEREREKNTRARWEER